MTAPTPYWSDDACTLYLGDCLDVLREMPDESVDAIVCDPPYGLANLPPQLVTAALTAWLAGDREHVPDGRGFMGRAWDAFVPPPAVWDQCARILKPGGHLLAFAGSRTVDLMTLSIRLAGFEIRDGIEWIYGSGFPKGTDVSKAIDKAAGAEREVLSERATGWTGTLGGKAALGGLGDAADVRRVTKPATQEASRWEGWNTSLKPAHEPVIVARKAFDGTVASTVLTYGTGALNIGACRVEHHGNIDSYSTPSKSGLGKNGVFGVSTREQGANSPTRYHDTGRWPTNIVFSHSASCVEGQACEADCPVGELDRQSGVSRSDGHVRGERHGTIYGNGAGPTGPNGLRGHNDAGGASRYFPTFRYQAKAPTSERPRLEDGTAWPTVKPVALMRWLVRLITPPGGLVVDPFSGSGTTGEACAAEGMRCILVDRDIAAAELTKVRLSKAVQSDLFSADAKRTPAT